MVDTNNNNDIYCYILHSAVYPPCDVVTPTRTATLASTNSTYSSSIAGVKQQQQQYMQYLLNSTINTKYCTTTVSYVLLCRTLPNVALASFYALASLPLHTSNETLDPPQMSLRETEAWQISNIVLRRKAHRGRRPAASQAKRHTTRA